MENQELQNLVTGYFAVLNEIEQMKEQAQSALNEMVELMCPVKIGDVVVITGYTHKGKKMVITRRWAQIPSWMPKPRLFITVAGDVIKKDGLPGLQTAENRYDFEI